MSKKVYLFSTSTHPKAIHVNSLDISFLQPSIAFSSYDYFIITSKQAVKSLEKYESKILKPALCISQLTANAYEELGGEVLSIGHGYGDTLIEQIKSYAKSTKWLYLRAQEVASEFFLECIENGYNIDQKIVYKSICSQDIQNIKVENDSVLIFTSPSSVKCFLNNNNINLTNKIIVIGNTTAKALPKNIKYVVSKSPTIEACLQLV